MESVELSLLTRDEQMPTVSGLNWGQREGREPNQAYIKVPSTVYSTDFFPDNAVPFKITTDDGKVFDCAIAQQNGKAIHTPANNSLLGTYFRERLGIPSGELVTLEALEKYGRTSVTIKKVNDTSYTMDFSI